MSMDEREDTTIYKVVSNHEEQYSIWPADKENPLGWSDAGKSGLKQECLAYIKAVCTTVSLPVDYSSRFRLPAKTLGPPPWFQVQPDSMARVRLFCFPYAGGG